MIWKILFILAVALEFVFVPYFLKFSWPKKCHKSMVFKMICSALFLAAGFLAVKISGNHTPYATMILWGLFLGLAGDFFLHLLTEKIYILGIGLFAFLGGHIFYIIAFQKAIAMTYPDKSYFRWYEIVGVIVLVGLIALYVIKKKVKAKAIMAVPVLLYAITISAMVAKAFRYCIGEVVYGTNDHMVMIFITIAVGAVLFLLSDATLGMILFAGQESNRPLKIFNIATYYAAQILLASSIFFVQSQLLYGT